MDRLIVIRGELVSFAVCFISVVFGDILVYEMLFLSEMYSLQVLHYTVTAEVMSIVIGIATAIRGCNALMLDK